MSKIVKNIVITVTAIIGFIAIVLAILTLLGFEIDIDCVPDCCKPASKKAPAKKPENPQTKIKRNYTEIKL